MNEPLTRLVSALTALMRWFDEGGVQGAVIGGVAASLRSTPRFTRDIDAVVINAETLELIQSANDFGFVPRIPDAAEFAFTTRVLLLRHDESNVDIDISLGALPFETEVVDRSTLLDVNGIPVRVATAEDLVIMKALAGRARDIADMENLVASHPQLDLDRIRRWVREFSSILEMPEIQENLERVLKSRKR
jgi:predicted nucleotidyltransferase